VEAAVNAAIATGDRSTMLALAEQLDNANNGSGGCPLDGESHDDHDGQEDRDRGL